MKVMLAHLEHIEECSPVKGQLSWHCIVAGGQAPPLSFLGVGAFILTRKMSMYKAISAYASHRAPLVAFTCQCKTGACPVWYMSITF